MKPEIARLVEEMFTAPTGGVDALLERLHGLYMGVSEHPNEAFRQRAVKMLYDFTTEAVVLFHLLPEPELAREARKEYLLPVLASPHPDSLKDIGDLVERLELGRSALIDMRAKGAKGRARFSLKTPVHLWTLLYFHRLLGFRERADAQPEPDIPGAPWSAKKAPDQLVQQIRSLPPFGVASRKLWADLAWKLLLFDHDGHPEKSQSLRQFGLHRAGHGRGKKGSKTYETDIRDGIERSFKAAFCRIPTRL